MPNTRIHCQIDKILFGKSFESIHRSKDAPIYFLGPFHHILNHDPIYNLSTENPASAFVHDLADAVTLPLVPIVFLIDPSMVLD